MDDVPASDLKTILQSKRANLYCLEHCCVLVNGGRVECVTDEGMQSLHCNIPTANITTVLLGTGTSITQAAVRELARAGVMLGCCSTGGTPLFVGTDQLLEVAWMPPHSEHRPSEYLQQWARFWFDPALRLAAANALQRARLGRLRAQWCARRAAHRGAGHRGSLGAQAGSLNAAPWLSTAQPMRAFFAAIATTAFQYPRRFATASAQRLRLSLLLLLLLLAAVSRGEPRSAPPSRSSPAGRAGTRLPPS